MSMTELLAAAQFQYEASATATGRPTMLIGACLFISFRQVQSGWRTCRAFCLATSAGGHLLEANFAL
jgi:hypothetical protein